MELQPSLGVNKVFSRFPGSGGPESLTSLLRKLLEATDLEPKLEELLTDIKRVQEARCALSRELQECREQGETAKRELEELKAEKLQLEQTLYKNQETLQKLQLQCERKGAETRRQKELSDSCKQRIGDLTNQIQEEKLKRRMQRLEYEKQVEELMAKHKDLWELYDKKRLSVQIPLMEERKVKLIGEEVFLRRKISAPSKFLTKPLSVTGARMRFIPGCARSGRQPGRTCRKIQWIRWLVEWEQKVPRRSRPVPCRKSSRSHRRSSFHFQSLYIREKRECGRRDSCHCFVGFLCLHQATGLRGAFPWHCPLCARAQVAPWRKAQSRTRLQAVSDPALLLSPRASRSRGLAVAPVRC
uniref:Synaptonemal complex central element protein 1 n=2 Tax=Xenopus tropicalis TaxID=8364 RepID=A0A803JF86_XENTR